MLILLEDVNKQISKICEKFGGFFDAKSCEIPLVVVLVFGVLEDLRFFDP